MPIVTGPGVPAFVPLEITAVFELLALGTLVFPTGRLLVAIYSADAQMASLNLESLSNDGWEPVTELAVNWAGVADKTRMFPQGIVTDGLSWRLNNTAGAAISGVQYYYMPV